jgi:hypothetical protein
MLFSCTNVDIHVSINRNMNSIAHDFPSVKENCGKLLWKLWIGVKIAGLATGSPNYATLRVI